MGQGLPDKITTLEKHFCVGLLLNNLGGTSGTARWLGECYYTISRIQISSYHSSKSNISEDLSQKIFNSFEQCHYSNLNVALFICHFLYRQKQKEMSQQLSPIHNFHPCDGSKTITFIFVSKKFKYSEKEGQKWRMIGTWASHMSWIVDEMTAIFLHYTDTKTICNL